jgi:hypothetical protein
MPKAYFRPQNRLREAKTAFSTHPEGKTDQKKMEPMQIGGDSTALMEETGGFH